MECRANSPVLDNIAYLEEAFLYDHETGVLRWKRRPAHHFPDMRVFRIWNAKYAGQILTGKDGNGYIRVTITPWRIPGHVLAWTLFHRRRPDHLIDHINRDKLDNRITNLREATRVQNSWNTSQDAVPKSGYVGVYSHYKTGKWEAKIRSEGRTIRLGIFKDPLDAHRAYQRAIQELRGNFLQSKGAGL